MADVMLLRAYKANARTVNLSCKKLQRVPRLIGDIQSIVHIDLKGNKLNVLPVELGNLMQVRLLCLLTCAMCFNFFCVLTFDSLGLRLQETFTYCT